MNDMKILKPLAYAGGSAGTVLATSLYFSGGKLIGAMGVADWKEDRTVDLIKAHLESKQARIPHEELREVAKTIYDASRSYGVDYRLVLAVMDTESNFRHDVVSQQGAIGIMQVKSIVAREFSREVGISYKKEVLQCPHANVRFGVYYLSWLSRYFDTDSAVLFAYNVGFTRARRSIQKDSEPHTRYTRKVIEEYERNRARFPVA